jgi:pimeloyl-ACP methyl ester carboxylesterase
MLPRWLQWALLAVAVAVIWQLLRTEFVHTERQARSQLKDAAERAFPAQAAAAHARYGLSRLYPARSGNREVVLVHGLDDPGKVWMNLAPALGAAGYGVSQMTYPNDQPVHDSAALLHASLRPLSRDGVDQVAIVAHSMGGLVTREMLTNPVFACGGAHCPIPRVRQLIMIGTPNHGSSLARFRGLGELREQFARILAGQAGWLDWIFDGAGEAGIDITPGSPFLTALNERPPPRGTAMDVIAGVIADDQAQAMDRLIVESVSGDPALRVAPLAERLGDGLVSLASARLPGVPLHRVQGNHLSIIRNLDAEDDRVPPAIPIVLELLSADRPTGTVSPDGPATLRTSVPSRGDIRQDVPSRAIALTRCLRPPATASRTCPNDG